MALRATKPESAKKRLKLLLFGTAGVGKTTAAVKCPGSYIIDLESGTDYYDEEINANGSLVFKTQSVPDIIQEVQELHRTQHDYRWLVIDPITTAYSALVDDMEKKFGNKYGKHKGEANKVMRRLYNLLTGLDMNVIITAHLKKEYAQGEKMELIGETFDGWDKLDYAFDLVLQLGRDPNFDFTRKARPSQKDRYAMVVKTRIKTFPDGEVFPWSYEALRQRYDASTLDRQARAASPATAEQVKQLRDLIEAVKLPDGTVERWLSAANAERFEDMPGEYVAKCIEYVQKRLPSPA